MKTYYQILILVVLSQFAIGQQKISVHNAGNLMYIKEIVAVDSIKLDNTYAKFSLSGVTSSLNFQKTVVDSLTFTTNTINLDKIYIIYNGNDAPTIINPYENSGLTITATGGNVVATAATGIENLEYHILGSSSNGSLSLTTDKNVNLVLNNLTLTNPSGAAFYLLGGKTASIYLTPGTTNTLLDGSASSRNGTIHNNGPIIIYGAGNLNVTGIKKHGINTTSTLTLLDGNTTIVNAASDGLHSEGFTMSGGTLTVLASTGDGVDAGDGAVAISQGTITITSTSNDVKGIKTGNNTLTISGGNITVTASGNQSKAISAKGNLTITGGSLQLTLTGQTVLAASGSGFDPSYPTAIKTDGTLTVTGGAITINATASATGAKGLSADGSLFFLGGTLTASTAGNGASYVNTLGTADSYATASLTADASITISGGTLNLTNSGSDGKGISADVDVIISGTPQLSITNSGTSGKAIKADGAIQINGGTITLQLSGATVLEASGSGFDPSYPTGLKATGTITINDGNLTITGTSSATGTKGISADGNILINGGTINVTTAGNGATYTNAAGAIDSYSSAAITTDANLIIQSGTVTTLSSGNGGKGLKSDGAITIGTTSSSPTLNITTTGTRFLVSGTDYAHPKTIVAAGAITINNGTNTINSTDDGIHSDTSITISGGTNVVNAISTITAMGEGVEAPIINFTGGINNITASNDGINATYGTVAGGTESDDGSQLNISGGIVIVAGKDAIDSNGSITITGGTTIVCGVTNGPEEGLDFNGSFQMNGGTIIAAGSNSNMTKNFSATSTQRTMFLKSSAVLSATSLIHIRTANGVELATFKPKNNVYYFHFSSPNIAGNESHQIYFGGSYSGGNFVGNSLGWGLYTGGTYSITGATLKKTFTTSNTSTLNLQTF